MENPYFFWISFHIVIFSLLALDMGFFQKRIDQIGMKQALLLSGFWIAIALAFNGYIYFFQGAEAALQFFTGYLVEKSLSLDNLFVFLTIFTYFKIPPLYQRKVLYWGILGALLLRIVLILAGVALIEKWHWITYLLGLFLVGTGVKFMAQKEQELSPDQNTCVRLLKRYIPLSNQKSKGTFFVVERGKWKMTYLFLVLVMIESTDVVFALDSIPAVFAVTTDPFIVYTSNIFAILGLRSLYFALAHVLDRLKYMRLGLSAILVFVGLKMVLAEIIPLSLPVALGIISAILLATIIFSLLSSRKR